MVVTGATCLITNFVMIHSYMTMIGKTPLDYVTTMIAGYGAIPLSKPEAAYLAETEPGRLK